MSLMLLVAMLVGVVLVVTSSSSSVRFVFDTSFEELLTCVQVGLIVYLIVFDVIFISHGPAFRSLAPYARAALSKLKAAAIWLFSPGKSVYHAVLGIDILRVVVRFLVAFVFHLVKFVIVSILRGVAFVIRRASWWVFRRVVAPCIRFALFVSTYLTCAACVYGCIIVATLWIGVTALLLCIPLRWLSQLCEPWSVPPGSFVFASDEAKVWHDRGWRLRESTSGKHGKSNIKLSVKRPLLRHEKYWDALDDLPGCTELFTITRDARLESDSKDSCGTTPPVLKPCAVLDAMIAVPPVDAPELDTPTLDLTTTDNKGGSTECDQAVPMARTTNDIMPTSEEQPEITPKSPKAIARASLSSILTSGADTSFESSLFDQDTTANTSLTSSSILFSPASSLTSLGDNKTPYGSEPQATDKLESKVESQPVADSNLAVKSDAPILPLPSAEPETPAESKPERWRVNKLKPLVKSQAPAPRKFKLPAKFSLSMSCNRFKSKAAPQPKSLNELPVQSRSNSGIILCSCESNRSALPLTTQMEKLKLRSHEPESEIQETEDMETPVVESAMESKPSDTADVGVQTVATAIKPTEGDAQVTKEKVDVPRIVVTAEDVADASTSKTVDPTGTITTDAAETLTHNMPTASEGLLGVPSATIGNMQVAPSTTGSDYISPFDAFLSEDSGLPMANFPSASGPGSNSQAGESGASQLPYFGQPEVNVGATQPELGFPGAPMMGGIPNMAPVPGLDLSLDFLAQLPKADLPFELDYETLVLLGGSEDFFGTLEGLWNGEPGGQSFSRSGAASPELPLSDPVANAAEWNAAQEVATPCGEQIGGKTRNEREEEGEREESPKRRRIAGRPPRKVRAEKTSA
ncbi:hypothetical protein FRC10_011637 [Ceratobasidium sp. 414]|nr:hypothetical protein FRC10_011637 [Ceratobasidium sp. 414]